MGLYNISDLIRAHHRASGRDRATDYGRGALAPLVDATGLASQADGDKLTPALGPLLRDFAKRGPKGPTYILIKHLKTKW